MNPPGAHRRIARWPFRVAGAALVMAIGAGTAMAQTVVTTTSGALEGAVGDGALRVFKGVPFAHGHGVRRAVHATTGVCN